MNESEFLSNKLIACLKVFETWTNRILVCSRLDSWCSTRYSRRSIGWVNCFDECEIEVDPIDRVQSPQLSKRVCKERVFISMISRDSAGLSTLLISSFFEMMLRVTSHPLPLLLLWITHSDSQSLRSSKNIIHIKSMIFLYYILMHAVSYQHFGHGYFNDSFRLTKRDSDYIHVWMFSYRIEIITTNRQCLIYFIRKILSDLSGEHNSTLLLLI